MRFVATAWVLAVVAAVAWAVLPSSVFKATWTRLAVVWGRRWRP